MSGTQVVFRRGTCRLSLAVFSSSLVGGVGTPEETEECFSIFLPGRCGLLLEGGARSIKMGSWSMVPLSDTSSSLEVLREPDSFRRAMASSSTDGCGGHLVRGLAGREAEATLGSEEYAYLVE